MALKKASKESPKIFTGAGVNPNTNVIIPHKIGDIFIDTSYKQMYFAFGLAGTQWGTCGTAGG